MTALGVRAGGKRTLGQLLSAPTLHLSIPERQCSGAREPSDDRFLGVSARRYFLDDLGPHDLMTPSPKFPGAPSPRGVPRQEAFPSATP